MPLVSRADISFTVTLPDVNVLDHDYAAALKHAQEVLALPPGATVTEVRVSPK